MLRTIEFSRKLADAGADAIQFTIYTPFPGTRIFYEALRGNKLLTLDWDRYDAQTPVMETRVHPTLIQMLQFYGNYSFYVRKFLMSRLKPRRLKGFKQNLVSNAERFIIDTMPTYLRDVLSLAAKLASTTKLCHSLTKESLHSEKVDESLQFSNKVIYQETGSKNRYFLIKEPA
jgi:anaerobic magnesium-protoporphyrin IX monomethyl ester cyclase